MAEGGREAGGHLGAARMIDEMPAAALPGAQDAQLGRLVLALQESALLVGHGRLPADPQDPLEGEDLQVERDPGGPEAREVEV